MSRASFLSLPAVATPSLEDRRTRQSWVHEQLEVRKKRHEQEKQEQAEQIQQLHQRQWSPYVQEVERTHELNVAWKHDRGFFTWGRVLGLAEDLEALRITGHPLCMIPETLFGSLRTLTTLSLIADQLESLPENIGVLQSLTELDLTKNRLVRLPGSITTLTTLRYLNLSSNLLETLPETFGALTNLDRLWLEHNRLTTLPDSIGDCLSVRIANFNNNLLTSLPDSIANMSNLVLLSVNLNQLIEFPDALTRMPALQSLHASRNQLMSLPRNIGSLSTLQDLRLDWNRIEELPFSFRLLTNLQTLCMERNPLKLPPLETISRGVRATMQYMERALDDFIRRSRREIVENVQRVLTFAMEQFVSTEPTENSNQDAMTGEFLAYFEPNTQHTFTGPNTETLPFFAVVWDSFLEQVLPYLEEKQSFKLLSRFTHDEVDDALEHYDDFFGPASIPRTTACFRRCACIDEVAFRLHGVRKRRVCAPPQLPFRCQRQARLIRMTMMTKEEAKDQLASTYLRRKIARLAAKTKRKCVDFINSEAGVLHFENMAKDLAKKLYQKRKRVRHLRAQHGKASAKLEKKKAALVAKLQAFEKTKATRLKTLETQLAKLQGERSALTDDQGKKAKRLDEKFAKLEEELKTFGKEDSVEDKKKLEIELALEGVEKAMQSATDDMERGVAKENKDGMGDLGGDDDESEDDEAEEKDDESDDEEPEGSVEEDDEGDDSEEEEEESPPPKPEAEGATEATRSFFAFEMPDLYVVDYRRIATTAIEKVLDEDPDPKRIANVEELLERYQQQLRVAYVEMQCALVEKKATYEFLQMRAVLRRWMGIGTRAVFEGWRDVMRANRQNAELVRAKRERKKILEAQNKALEEELKRVEAQKWVQRVDMYTDAVYFEHAETGVTSWTPPVYWEEEQAKQRQTTNVTVPTLRLPPI
ncbi:hypothetical protein Poli38472_011868 [Pythium oligandrum]|uniref:WW domain-containing protein n=1 Tax=Pythium oligandrum TaxID=41045 RepID=A0A8K1C8L3_PYTOL|nr:hypothetical protein Poli38472_011868 [Pythium oligandrum]|eukprot:TMW58280.1 hypothetical protein Poli38472_011868 [Pythium oligandrum]